MIAAQQMRVTPITSDLIRGRISTVRRLFLFLDFDGTLAPLVNVPCLATLPNEFRTVLKALMERPDVTPVIISGRGIEDLQSRVGLPLLYSGDHGLEIRGGGLDYSVPEAQALRLRLLSICNRLRTSLEPYPGALVECKRLSASVHLRQVEAASLPLVNNLLRKNLQAEPAFEVFGGKDAFEIRPKLHWNKGYAARWILEQMNGNESDTICIGDDITDEDLFSELSNGITVRVGCSSTTAARYWVHEAGVLRLLEDVLESLELHRAGP